MIKKYTILTLIFGLITTSAFSITPDNIFKLVDVLQDTQKSIFQRVMQYLQEIVGLSYAQEKAANFDYDRSEMMFIIHNKTIVNIAKRKWENFKNLSADQQKYICNQFLNQEVEVDIAGKKMKFNINRNQDGSFYTVDDSWVEEALENPYGFFKKQYRLIKSALDEHKQKAISDEEKESIAKMENFLNSLNPNFNVLVGQGHLESELFWEMILLSTYCRQCQKKNNWD